MAKGFKSMSDLQCLHFEGLCDQPLATDPQTGERYPDCGKCPHMLAVSDIPADPEQDALRETLESLQRAGYAPDQVDVFDQIAYGDGNSKAEAESGGSGV
jgi:hypothetical protein